jgi:hypothetical protein
MCGVGGWGGGGFRAALSAALPRAVSACRALGMTWGGHGTWQRGAPTRWRHSHARRDGPVRTVSGTRVILSYFTVVCSTRPQSARRVARAQASAVLATSPQKLPSMNDFIVSFTSYLRPDRAHQIVHDALHGQRGCTTAGSWRVLPRRNAAYRLPSDFALVRLHLTRAHRRRALRALRRHSSVRLLSPERRYGAAEPMPSKHLQSYAEQEPPEPSPRHAEPASLGQSAHSPYSYLECGADADAAYGVGRSGRLGRGGRPVADFSFAAKCSSGGGSSGGGGGGGGGGSSSSVGRFGGGGSNASLGRGPARRLLFPGHTGNQGRREAAPQITARLHAEVRTPSTLHSYHKQCIHARPMHARATMRAHASRHSGVWGTRARVSGWLSSTRASARATRTCATSRSGATGPTRRPLRTKWGTAPSSQAATPHVLEAAAPLSPMRWRLQPYVLEAAALHAGRLLGRRRHREQRRVPWLCS